MKVSDYIVNYLKEKNVTDVFGYPGGMVTHLMDSLKKSTINVRMMYHEQALSFAACSYAQSSNKTAIAYATSGPGATNLVTGIANAFFDSIPIVFITGQVNRNESNKDWHLRQRGFQETDIVSVVRPITKKAVYVDSPKKIKFYLDEAFFIANDGRKGPVLLDIPMDVFKQEIKEEELDSFVKPIDIVKASDLKIDFSKYQRPVLLLGAGTKYSCDIDSIRKAIDSLGIPVVTSMIAFDILEKDNPLNFGFIGAYGHRTANFIVAKADLIISIGSRMDIRQVGFNRHSFAPKAHVVRIDVDSNELNNKLHDDDTIVETSAALAMNCLLKSLNRNYDNWVETCYRIRSLLKGIDRKSIQEKYIEIINKKLSGTELISTDVGQNQVWIAQYLNNKTKNRVFFSGGLGSMGYSLPASIGLS